MTNADFGSKNSADVGVNMDVDTTFPYPVSKEVFEKAKTIQLAIFDVDGVLTDGKLFYGELENGDSSETKIGESLKVFNALDGHGLKMLQKVGIEVAIITARQSPILEKRMSDLGIKHCYYGAQNKLTVFKELINKLNLDQQHCAYTGDDVIDLPVMMRCGLKFSVANGHYITQNVADWVSPIDGGNGAVRSICDLLLTSQNKYPLDFSSSQ